MNLPGTVAADALIMGAAAVRPTLAEGALVTHGAQATRMVPLSEQAPR